MSTAPVDFGAAARGLSKANGAALAPDVADSDSGPRPAALRCLTADEFFAAESPANLVVPALGICPGPPTGFVGRHLSARRLSLFRWAFRSRRGGIYGAHGPSSAVPARSRLRAGAATYKGAN